MLALAALVAGGAAGLPVRATAQPRWRAQPFGLGVASGSPTSGSVVLWTRLLGALPDDGGAPIPVRWELAHDDAFRHIIRSGDTQALPALAHSVHVEVEGLAPDRWYHYRFTSGDAVSATGRTRTLPAPDAAPARLRLAHASCQRWEHGHYAAWRHMREEAPDFVAFLGDYIYEYPNVTAAVRSFPTLGWVRNLAEYRERYALHRSDPDLQAMHASCPWLVTWDDHEVQNDYAGAHAGDPFPLGMNGVADFAARRAAAYQAFYEHMPVRAAAFAQALAGRQPGGELRLYTHYRFGRLAEVLLLDTRQYRDAQACVQGRKLSGPVDPARCQAWNDPGRTLLGPAQEQWLDRRLEQGGATWTVVGQQTLFGRRDLRPGNGELLSNDGWDGYPAARTRITDALQRHQVANPVFLAGDVHENWVGHLKADYARPDSASLGVELCGTSITSKSRSVEFVAQRLAENPHFLFADAAHRGYGLTDYTPGRLTATLRVLDDATRRDARVSTLAQFAVEAGRRRLERL
ncbi:MAG TPA: alkaline phosphatase D family protein [Ramlibacter sp.]|uniref:alkaline phosphatase D family protein n=1 Tax=Ramlibacter sp. TaxID=1917967 RepID=UPI002D538A4F|nr:alkaline phosphatase D family protein [Ramlibacter sp.]HZY18164.1 alkaline phosphatase D family protein [Ramlibacter sp.]